MRIERILSQLETKGTLLAPAPSGGFGIFARGDRRRRPLARLSQAQVRELEATGAIMRCTGQGDCFVLSSAGAARVTRAASAPDEAYAAQHRPIVSRTAIDAEGVARHVRGHDADALRKLAALRDVTGCAWFSADELAAAQRLRGDWEIG
ncbi:MAG: hypothetical protein JSS00_07235, partial [Proteobacteria bacterium]|nr:hypothetical protein [Pseudomonadota bacterium]